MLKEDIKNIKSEKSDLRKFGLSVGIVLGILGGLFRWRGKESYTFFLYISSALISLGVLLPSVLKPLQKAWMSIAVVMGWFMTRVILSILFYLVVTPIGIIARLFGKDFLDKKFNQANNINIRSYWIPKEKSVADKSRYEKQF